MDALISPGPASTVQQLFSDKPSLHPSLTLIDVSAIMGIAVGWTFSDKGEFAPPPFRKSCPSRPKNQLS